VCVSLITANKQLGTHNCSEKTDKWDIGILSCTWGHLIHRQPNNSDITDYPFSIINNSTVSRKTRLNIHHNWGKCRPIIYTFSTAACQEKCLYMQTFFPQKSAGKGIGKIQRIAFRYL